MRLQSARTVGVILSIPQEDAMTASKRAAPDSGAAAADPIRHVVHLILENRSFDQMMGSLSAIYADLDGVDPKNLHSNSDIDGHSFAQAPTTERQMPKWDPHHEVPHVAEQLSNGNTGFVRDYSEWYEDSTATARQLIMSYYPLDFLPALHALGRNLPFATAGFRLCQGRPGPTGSLRSAGLRTDASTCPRMAPTEPIWPVTSNRPRPPCLTG